MMSKVLIVGTVGHIDHSKAALVAALTRASHDVIICEPEQLSPPYIVIKAPPSFPEPVVCGDIQRKSKGEKKRDRAERRRMGFGK